MATQKCLVKFNVNSKIFKVQLQLGNICINLVATGIFNPYKCIKDKCNICKRKLKVCEV